MFLVGTHTGDKPSRRFDVVGSEDLLGERAVVAMRQRVADAMDILERDLQAYLRGGTWTEDMNDNFIED